METLYSDIDNQCHLFATLMWTPTHFYVHISCLYIFFALQAGISKYSLDSYKLPSPSTKYAREETGDRAVEIYYEQSGCHRS